MAKIIGETKDMITGGYRRTEDGAPLDGEPTESEIRQRQLSELADQIRICQKCALHSERTNAVPGFGPIDPLVMVIGEGPGYEEDRQGNPFVGRSGKYLDKWLASIDLSRNTNVFITNVVKCRPPSNRDPEPQEAEACNPYLIRQIELVRPRVFLILGRIAACTIFNEKKSLKDMRNKVLQYQEIPLIVTYHPSAVLRNPNWRKPVWDDLNLLKSIING